MLVEELLPVFDNSDELAVVVEADRNRTWQALMDVDFVEVGKRRPLTLVLGALRVLPEIVSHLLHGEAPPKASKQMRLRDLGSLPRSAGGWIPLGEREGEEIALGLVGKFWRPVIDYAEVAPEDFRDFAEPGYAKTIYAFSLRPLEPGRTLLTATMRTATTDEHARSWFRRYWTFGVGSGAHILVNGVLDLVREDAEAGM